MQTRRTGRSRPDKGWFTGLEIQKSSVFILMGRELSLKVMCKHEIDWQYGRAVPYEAACWGYPGVSSDANINSIRTSHYPYPNRMGCDLCDEYGIYLADEVNLESHGSWFFMHSLPWERTVPGKRPAGRNSCAIVTQTVFYRDRNHACVISWSLGS